MIPVHAPIHTHTAYRVAFDCIYRQTWQQRWRYGEKGGREPARSRSSGHWTPRWVRGWGSIDVEVGVVPVGVAITAGYSEETNEVEAGEGISPERPSLGCGARYWP